MFNPPPAKCRRRSPLASDAELNHAIAEAAKAQVAWAATNPQRRARVMMAFGALINANAWTSWPNWSAANMAKTYRRRRGDMQRGLEVVEVCMGAPAMLKGEYMDSAGPGIDLYAMRQPLGVVAGITPFLPGHDPRLAGENGPASRPAMP